MTKRALPRSTNPKTRNAWPFRTVLIVGGGIIGCSAAAFVAERGASVLLVEASAIGAGASGRNSGVVQHPFDPVLAPLHEATLEHYRALADGDFAFPPEPAGLLLLTDDDAAGHARVAELNASEPSLAAAFLDEQALRQREPMLAGGLSAVLLATGYPIPPHAATQAMAARAERAGAHASARRPRRASIERRASRLLLDDGTSLVRRRGPGRRRTLERRAPGSHWRMATDPPDLRRDRPGGALARLRRASSRKEPCTPCNRPVAEDEPADGLFTFSMVTAGGVSTVGSTFLPAAPDPQAFAPQLVAHGARFVPALGGAAIVRSRVCARPQSVDGRPFIGAGGGHGWRLRVCRARPMGDQHRTGLRLADHRQHP